jgi:DNA-binding transcriptional MerR regulator
MFQIGEFSKIARISTRQLRHYDELGLFKPLHIDPKRAAKAS